MSSTAHRTRALAGVPLLLAAALLGACQFTTIATTEWATTATNDAGGPHVVTVTDHTGNVAEVQFFPEDADLFGGSVTVAPGKPDAIDVVWTGGSCDAATDIEITAKGGGMGVAVVVTGDGNPCDAMGTPRAIRLTLDQPVLPANVIVTEGAGGA